MHHRRVPLTITCRYLDGTQQGPAARDLLAGCPDRLCQLVLHQGGVGVGVGVVVPVAVGTVASPQVEKVKVRVSRVGGRKGEW